MIPLSGLETIPVQERHQLSLFQKEVPACLTCMFQRELMPLSLNTVSLMKWNLQEDLSGACHGPKFNSSLPNKISPINSKLELAQLMITFLLVLVSLLFSDATQEKTMRVSLTSFTELVSINWMNNSRLLSPKEWEFWLEVKLILRFTTSKVTPILLPWNNS